MKARIKATGEIVDVTRIIEKYVVTHDPRAVIFNKDELDFDIEDDPDYWTKLEHQAAIAAMQGIITNPIGFGDLRARHEDEEFSKVVAEIATDYAHALVQKLKEKEE